MWLGRGRSGRCMAADLRSAADASAPATTMTVEATGAMNESATAQQPASAHARATSSMAVRGPTSA